MTSNFLTISVHTSDGVAHIEMGRSRQLNAINEQMMNEISTALRALEVDDDVRAIVLSGSGRAFSAGFDLKESAQQQRVTIADWTRVLTADFDFIMQFWSCAKPTIAAVHGYCIGGALELAVACDLTVADVNAVFGMPEVKFGSTAVSLILPWIIGPKFAKELLLTGDDKLDAKRAYEIGLINRMTEPDQHLKVAGDLAKAIANASPLSVQVTKRSINRGVEAAGLQASLRAALDAAILIESAQGPERTEFNRIREQQGLNAAVKWRNSRG
jgi:enoyl-CoA hydratase